MCSRPAEMKLSFQTLVGTGVANGFPDKTQSVFPKLNSVAFYSFCEVAEKLSDKLLKICHKKWGVYPTGVSDSCKSVH